MMNVSCDKDNFDNREVISLFSGAMGLDIGLYRWGIYLLAISTHFQMHQNRAHRCQTLYDAFFDLEQDCGEYSTFSKKYLDTPSYIPQGGNWRNLPDSLKKLAMGGAYSSSGGKVGFYRRLSYKQPSPTLVTSPTQKATMLCHPT